MILSAAAQLIFAYEKALVSYIRVLQKSSQFTRAIRKTASAMLSAAAQLIFAHDIHVRVNYLPNFMVKEILFFCRSTSRILTSTMSPTLTASSGCLM